VPPSKFHEKLAVATVETAQAGFGAHPIKYIRVRTFVLPGAPANFLRDKQFKIDPNRPQTKISI
jgi:hypothetical protein